MALLQHVLSPSHRPAGVEVQDAPHTPLLSLHAFAVPSLFLHLLVRGAVTPQATFGPP